MIRGGWNSRDGAVSLRQKISPRGESLEMVANLTRPFLNEILTPTLDAMAREKRL
jgi:hypothetical protein